MISLGVNTKKSKEEIQKEKEEKDDVTDIRYLKWLVCVCQRREVVVHYSSPCCLYCDVSAFIRYKNVQ